jgi:hypothetical protein
MSIVNQKPYADKSVRKQSARTVFRTAAQRHTYRHNACAYRDWSFRPERAAKDDFKKEVQ